MADHTLARIFTLGISMLFEKKEADLEKPIYAMGVSLVRVGLTESKVKSLLNVIIGLDFVAVPDNYMEDMLERAEEGSCLVVLAQEDACTSVHARLMEESIVKEVSPIYLWNLVPKSALKEKFREHFMDRFFCPACDGEKESQTAPCENGECRIGLANFRQIEAANAALRAQIEQINADGESVVDIAAATTPHCPSCGGTDLDGPDCDDDYYCNDCDIYHDVEECYGNSN